MKFETKEQEAVVNCKLNQGYSILGTTVSLTNGLSSVALVKGKHMLVVNSLGYDEHFQGKTWNIK